jgi:hypothetical protein
MTSKGFNGVKCAYFSFLSVWEEDTYSKTVAYTGQFRKALCMPRKERCA